MPKKADEKLKTDKGTYKSRIEASQQYDKNNVDNIRLRVPKGYREKMQAHVNTLPQYEVKGKDNHSVNAWLLDLIKNEIDNNE